MTLDEPRRPDPDALLAEAAKAGRGRLKVFLGMSPGVGKTYEMLSQGARRQAEGRDVVVGLVETHGRKETEALTAGLEILPRRPVEYRDRTLMEFDIDAALARKPELLLVDEFAHSNAPGSRHPKRWQDVEELLAAGISVWTTLNIQHLESLVDVVWKITGVRQRETVPDGVISKADEIAIVDITPAELRQRLAEGKVYVPETARLASENFFKPENLTALRELALRRAAQAVDDELVGAMRRAGVAGPWQAGERILVLVSGDPMADHLVRTGRRLAEMMNAPWTVAHVERTGRAPPSAASLAKVHEAMKLAEQLGGATVTLTAQEIVSAVVDYCGKHNVTQVIIGKSRDSRWREALGRSFAGAMMREAHGVALHVVTESASGPPGPSLRQRVTREPGAWRSYLPGVGYVALATVIAWYLDISFRNSDLGMIFLAAVFTAAVLQGLRPALLAAVLAFFDYNYFFLKPRYSFAVGRPTDVLTLLVFLAVALVTGILAGRVRDAQAATLRRAAAITSLLSASRRLSAAAEKMDAATALAEQLSAATGGRGMILLPEGGEITPAAAAPEMTPLSTQDMAAARWAWEHGEAAGAGTGTLPGAAWTFWPMQGISARVGVAATEPRPGGGDDERFVLSLLDQGAIAVERAELAAEASEADALRRSERLRTALLNSISHDLRTPLAGVLGATTTLLEYGPELERPVQVDLLESIRDEAERLNRYVGNLLDMTRLEGGGVAPRTQSTDLRDVVTAAAERVARRLGKRELVRDYPPTISTVPADPALLEQALVNILENAIAYSDDGSRIEAAVYEDERNVVISIEDEGRGIPTAQLQQVFEKFLRLDESSDRGKGTGLGLAIAKGFVDAMGGRIAAASPIHDGKGTRILISLPKEKRTPHWLL
ncbi:MAG TPA: sensor histidine kinase KdpD [Caulobacteraceae bacterium]|jgi:two-component system sensor histidine kinase KdpD|nr:sensor histidine kinase KdpD [Caulobacteraceae bacterium]